MWVVTIEVTVLIVGLPWDMTNKWVVTIKENYYSMLMVYQL